MFTDKKCVIHPTHSALSFCHSCKGFLQGPAWSRRVTTTFAVVRIASQQVEQEASRKRSAVRAAYAQHFCDTCIDATTDISGGKLFVTMNGFGARLLGRRNPCSRCSSVEATAWLCVFFPAHFSSRPVSRRLAWWRFTRNSWLKTRVRTPQGLTKRWSQRTRPTCSLSFSMTRTSHPGAARALPWWFSLCSLGLAMTSILLCPAL